MNNSICRLGAIFVATVLFLTTSGLVFAQAASPSIPAKSALPDELSQTELLKSYLQMREQLQATQLAIATNRIEAEVTARAQAAAVGEKFESIKSSMEAERERHRMDTERAQAQRADSDRQQAELQRSNRTVLWIAAVFGALALVAIVVSPILQWRAINHLAETAAARPALHAPAPSMLPAEAGTFPDHTVTVSTQRMQGMIERMERRILELEHTATHPMSSVASGAVATTSTVLTVDSPRRLNHAIDDVSVRIKSLMSKGHGLLNEGKAKEAVGCYNEVLKLDLNHPEALVKRGAALERLKQDDEAIQCYDRAIKAEPNMTLAYLYKGGVCNRLERYEEATRCYEQALRTEDESRAAANARI
ncbi:MAG: tetratricopeptide repeat protein [Opitutus sp.]